MDLVPSCTHAAGTSMWASVLHFDLVVRPVLCVGLDVLTQCPLHSFQATKTAGPLGATPSVPKPGVDAKSPPSSPKKKKQKMAPDDGAKTGVEAEAVKRNAQTSTNASSRTCHHTCDYAVHVMCCPVFPVMPSHVLTAGYH